MKFKSKLALTFFADKADCYKWGIGRKFFTY